MLHFTALVTCLAILLYFFTSIRVARARAAFGIKAPAIIRQSRLRAGVSRADEHAGMDADFPALALAVCNLYQRSHRRRHWPRLDRRPHPLHDRLLAGRRKARGEVFAFRRWLRAFFGWARWARSSDASFTAEGPTARSDPKSRSDIERRPLCALHSWLEQLPKAEKREGLAGPRFGWLLSGQTESPLAPSRDWSARKGAY